MHAYIIEGGSQKERDLAVLDILTRCEVASSETHTIFTGEGSIGIEVIQEQIHWLSLRPIASKSNAFVISRADHLTDQAQNALLKTLEEPPKHTIVLLELADSYRLLQTILSRCQIIRLMSQSATLPDKPFLDVLQELTGRSRGTCIEANSMHNKEEILNYLALLEQHVSIVIMGEAVSRATYAIYVKIYLALLTTRSQLSLNANPKLAMDCFFLSVLSQQG